MPTEDPDHDPASPDADFFARVERELHALAHAPDAALVDHVASRIAVPKGYAADSFLLHAPLELLARATLLGLVPPHERPLVRARIVAIGVAFEAHGPARAPRQGTTPRSTDEGLARLRAAIALGELDDAEGAATFLAEHEPAARLATLIADTIVPHLGAAAHGAIFLDELRRGAPRSLALARCLGGLVRELAREATARLTWFEARDARADASDELEARLCAAPHAGDPGTTFIAPTMALVERSGLAAALLDGPTRALSVRDAGIALGRVAAVSMLVDDPAHAPYGWSHCLTIPRAILALAAGCRDPRDAVAAAATHALGFRATLSRGAIDPAYTPALPADHGPFDLRASPSVIASRVFHAPEVELPAMLTSIATFAAIHPDAHLAKYVLASLDAARCDSRAARLHLAAAGHLASLWANRGTPDPWLEAHAITCDQPRPYDASSTSRTLRERLAGVTGF